MNREYTEKISTKRTYLLLRMALYQALVEKPFEKITLTDICNRSMVPRSTFYRYFEDKYDLLRYSLSAFFDEAHLSPDVIFSTNIESLRGFFITLFTHLEKHRADYVKMYQLNRQGILIDSIREFLIQILSGKIQEAQEAGIRLKVPTSLFTYLLAEFYISTAKCYLEAEKTYTVKEFVDGIADFANKEFFE